MRSHPSWHLPFAVAAGGAMQAVALVAGYPALSRIRQFLILGLDKEQWFLLLLLVSALAVMVGLAISCSRLERAGKAALAGLAGVAALFGTIAILYVGFIAWVFSSDERTEIALSDGRSIVVTQFCWHHCSLWTNQREGIFIDNALHVEGVEDVHYDFSEGAFTVEQRGDSVTLRTEQGSLTAYLE